jgi:hypothetical protein
VEQGTASGSCLGDLGRPETGDQKGAIRLLSVRISTVSPDAERRKSAMSLSAISLPCPMTTRWSAASAISVMRWLETSTARPSAANALSMFRSQTMPSGSSPLTGSSNSRVAGSPSSAAPMPSRCPIPSEYVLARLRATDSSPTSSSTFRSRSAPGNR